MCTVISWEKRVIVKVDVVFQVSQCDIKCKGNAMFAKNFLSAVVNIRYIIIQSLSTLLRHNTYVWLIQIIMGNK